jgi:hypothetical protein
LNVDHVFDREGDTMQWAAALTSPDCQGAAVGASYGLFGVNCDEGMHDGLCRFDPAQRILHDREG